MLLPFYTENAVTSYFQTGQPENQSAAYRKRKKRNARDLILSKQEFWEAYRSLEVVGSEIEHGQKVYCLLLENNLFQPLHPDTLKELERGSGGELVDGENHVPKIHALHLSSALGANALDYWRQRQDLPIPTTAYGLSAPGSHLTGSMHFKYKITVCDPFQFRPNLDVLILTEHTGYQAFGIECKFSEPWGGRHHAGMDSKYREESIN